MRAALGLGTAQFGMRYGVSNREGQVPLAEAAAILETAASQGCRILDTAALYGESEDVLGRCETAGRFRIVTKTPQFRKAAIDAGDAAELRAAFHRSLERLRQPRVYGLLCHHADDLVAPGGERLWDEMLALKSEGLVDRIGTSVYEAEHIELLQRRYALDLVQAPVNVLDQRLLRDGSLGALRSGGTEVHARSAFLQGLLLMSPDEVPAWFDPIRPLLREFHRAATASGCSPLEAALAFVRDQADVDVVLVGVTGRTQFAACLAAFNKTSSFDAGRFACADRLFLNPALWRLA